MKNLVSFIKKHWHTTFTLAFVLLLVFLGMKIMTSGNLVYQAIVKMNQGQVLTPSELTALQSSLQSDDLVLDTLNSWKGIGVDYPVLERAEIKNGLPFSSVQKIVVANSESPTSFDISVPSGGSHLKIFGAVRYTDNVSNAEVGIRFNGDTGNNYNVARWTFSDNTSAVSGFLLGSHATASFAPGTSADSDSQGTFEYTIYNYGNNTYVKVGFGFWYLPEDTTGSLNNQLGSTNVFEWNSPNPITSITVYSPDSYIFDAGSFISVNLIN